MRQGKVSLRVGDFQPVSRSRDDFDLIDSLFGYTLTAYWGSCLRDGLSPQSLSGQMLYEVANGDQIPVLWLREGQVELGIVEVDVGGIESGAFLGSNGYTHRLGIVEENPKNSRITKIRTLKIKITLH